MGLQVLGHAPCRTLIEYQFVGKQNSTWAARMDPQLALVNCRKSKGGGNLRQKWSAKIGNE